MMKIFNCALGLCLAEVVTAHGPGNFTNVLNFGDSWAWLGKGELEKALKSRGVDFSDCYEKSDLVCKIQALQ